MSQSISLEALSVAHIMQKEVVVVEPVDSLQEAMQQMTEHHVIELPVVDSNERCVGVVSASDILRFAEADGTTSDMDGARLRRFFNPERNDWESVGVADFAMDRCERTPVGELMSRDLLSVSPATTVQEAAQLMHERKVDRILVLDDARQLQGIISNCDFVRAVAFGR